MTDSDCEKLIQCILDCIENFRSSHPPKTASYTPSLLRKPPARDLKPFHDEGREVDERGKSIPEGLKPVRGEPGVFLTPSGKKVKPVSHEPGLFRTPSGRKVDGRGNPVSKNKRKPSAGNQEQEPRTTSFCKWILGEKPQKKSEASGKPPRSSLKPDQGEPGGRFDESGIPFPEGLTPVSGEPGTFRTPSGTKVDERGRPIVEGLRPVRGEPGVFLTPSGKKVDDRGREIPDGLKPVDDEPGIPVPNQPGVFRTPSGRKVDKNGRPIPKSLSQVPRDDSRKDQDKKLPEKSKICDWIIGKKSTKKPFTKDLKSADPSVEPVEREPGVFRAPSGEKVDEKGRPISAVLKPIKDMPGVFITPSGKKVDIRGKPIPEGLEPVTGEPGVYGSPSRRKVVDRDRPVSKDRRKETNEARESTAEFPTSSFCKWIMGIKPEKKPLGLSKSSSRPSRGSLKPVKGAPTGESFDKFERPIPEGLTPVSGEPGTFETLSGRKVDKRGNPIPESLKPVRGEIGKPKSEGLKPIKDVPGVFKTPSGRKVDSRGEPIPDNIRPVKGEPGVFLTPSGKKVDVRGKPIPEGFKPVSDEPGLFKTPSGRKVDDRGRPISKDRRRFSDKAKVPIQDFPTRSFCDWILGRKPEKKSPGAKPSRSSLKPSKREPGVFTTPSGGRYDNEGNPIPEGLTPVDGKPGVFQIPSGRKVNVRGEPLRSKSDKDKTSVGRSGFEPDKDHYRDHDREAEKKKRTRSFCEKILGIDKPDSDEEPARRRKSDRDGKTEPYRGSKIPAQGKGDDRVDTDPSRESKSSKPSKSSSEDFMKDPDKFDVDDCEEFIECVQKCLMKHKELKKRRSRRKK